MSFWHRFNKRNAQAQHAHSELDACLNLLSSAPGGRGRDQTDAILSRVGQSVPLVSGRSMRWLTAGRIAIGLGLAASLAAGAFTLHAWRDTASMQGLLGQSAPASRAMASAAEGVNSALRSVTSAGQSVTQIRPALLAATIDLQPSRVTVPAPRATQPRPAVSTLAIAMLSGPTGATVLHQPAPALGVIDRVLPARAPCDLAESVAWQLTRPSVNGSSAADLPMPR